MGSEMCIRDSSGTIAHVLVRPSTCKAAARGAVQQLRLRRVAFLWCDSSASAERTGMYATCWQAVIRGHRQALASVVLAAGAGPYRGPISSFCFGDVVTYLGGGSRAQPSLQSIGLALSLTQQLLGGTSRLLVVTSGSVASEASHAACDAAHGGAWGYARVVRLEQPLMRAVSADVARFRFVGGTALSERLLCSEMETEVSSGRRDCAARLRCVQSGDLGGTALVTGAYTITGGLGGLGLRAAALLVKHGASDLFLASRSGQVTRTDQGLTPHLLSLGACARVSACDSAVKNDVSALCRSSPLSLSLLHASGVGDKGLVTEIEPSRLRWMYEPKAFGASYLQGGTVSRLLEAQVLWSSVGAGLGNVGQGNYAAGNAYLDAHTSARRATGMAAFAMQWPLIGGAGICLLYTSPSPRDS